MALKILLMRRAIHFARRNMPLLVFTALLMAGAGCVSAVRTTGDQLTEDALKPITVPVQVYKQGIDAASGVDAYQHRQIEEAGGL